MLEDEQTPPRPQSDLVEFLRAFHGVAVVVFAVALAASIFKLLARLLQ